MNRIVDLIFAYADAMICKLCYTRPPQIALYPCGHVMCMGCLESLQQFRCPWCRAEFDHGMRIYLGLHN